MLNHLRDCGAKTCGIGDMNNNGELFADLWVYFDLIPSRPQYSNQNQIDHIARVEMQVY